MVNKDAFHCGDFQATKCLLMLQIFCEDLKRAKLYTKLRIFLLSRLKNISKKERHSRKRSFDWTISTTWNIFNRPSARK